MPRDDVVIRVLYRCYWSINPELSPSSFSVDVTDDISEDGIGNIVRNITGEGGGMFEFEADAVSLELIDVEKNKYWFEGTPNIQSVLQNTVDALYPIVGTKIGEAGLFDPWRAEYFSIYINNTLRFTGLCFADSSPIQYDDDKSTIRFTVYDPSILLKRFIMGRLGVAQQYYDGGYDSFWWLRHLVPWKNEVTGTITDFILTNYRFAYRHRYVRDTTVKANGLECGDADEDCSYPADVLLDEGDIRRAALYMNNGTLEEIAFRKKFIFSSHGGEPVVNGSELDSGVFHQRYASPQSTYHGGVSSVPVGHYVWKSTPVEPIPISGDAGLIASIISQFNGWCPFFTINVVFPSGALSTPSITGGGIVSTSGILPVAHLFWGTFNGKQRFFVASFSAVDDIYSDEGSRNQRYALHEIVNRVDLYQIASGSFPSFEDDPDAPPISGRITIYRGQDAFMWGHEVNNPTGRMSLEMTGSTTNAYFGSGAATDNFDPTDVKVGIYINESANIVSLWRRSCRRYYGASSSVRIYNADPNAYPDGRTYGGPNNTVYMKKLSTNVWEVHLANASPYVYLDSTQIRSLYAHNIYQNLVWRVDGGNAHIRTNHVHLVSGLIPRLDVPRSEWFFQWVDNLSLKNTTPQHTSDRKNVWKNYRVSVINNSDETVSLQEGIAALVTNTRAITDWPISLHYVLKYMGLVFDGTISVDELAFMYEDTPASNILVDIAKITNSVFKLIPTSFSAADLYMVDRDYGVNTLILKNDWIVRVDTHLFHYNDDERLSIGSGIIGNEFYNEHLSDFYRSIFTPTFVREYTIELVTALVAGESFDMLWKVENIGGFDFGIVHSIDYGEDTIIIKTRKFGG